MVALWERLVAKHPREQTLQDRLWLACKRIREDRMTAVWESLVPQQPKESGKEDERWLAGTPRYWDKVVGVWRRLVEMNPRETVLQDQLSLGCKLHGDINTAISVWESLIDKYPEAIWFYPRLNRLLEDKRNGTLEAILSWKKLVEKYPNIPSLQGQLYQAFGTRGTEEAVMVWAELVKSNPDVLSMREYLDGAIRAKWRRDALAKVNLLKSNIADSEHLVPPSIPVLRLVQPSGAFTQADVASRHDISPAVTLANQITTKPMDENFDSGQQSPEFVASEVDSQNNISRLPLISRLAEDGDDPAVPRSDVTGEVESGYYVFNGLQTLDHETPIPRYDKETERTTHDIQKTRIISKKNARCVIM
jgi:hypothetical protein